jgi:hypothetical protein
MRASVRSLLAEIPNVCAASWILSSLETFRIRRGPFDGHAQEFLDPFPISV